MSSNEKTIAITGAASGIGRATAVYLASRGASLAISDVQTEALKAVAEELKTANPDIRVEATVLDVSKPEEVRDWIQDTKKTFGRLDGAANIAGTGASSQVPLEAQSDQEWEFLLGINLSGTMFCLREELKHISDGGSIVNASSVLGLRSFPGHGGSAYVASKHAVLGLTRNAAREYGHRKIRVNCINPGGIATPMMQPKPGEADPMMGMLPPISRMGKPEEVAALVGFLLGDESTYISGTSVVIDGGLTC
ncbi:3-oxoacyl-(acyl-carrier-protein) reductase [Colletotrichum fioriniae PJ7]|uniref:3-oxoacyl-(Acyl-carrier-protein) reductase n=1 Tax=Colletotrichum fioriniae PJ7 TaxID=1445577 RepID=A0A010QHW9_9PEZI|nr:3-oxoacyl-(acyl-carrier-protein) reductase [Colletotrichum fioriniae PJ7]